MKIMFYLFSFLLFFSGSNLKVQKQPLIPSNYDVIVYGATPAGIAAAVNAAREGASVILCEETGHVGGLTSSGLSNTDFHSFEALGGTWLEFMDRVEQYYLDIYGPNSQQVKDCWRGAFYEPKVAKKVFMDMIEEQNNIELALNHLLINTTTTLQNYDRLKLTGILLKDRKQDKRVELRAKVFIDATYEGDLLAAAGCNYVVGSEGPEKYGEPAASPKDWHVQCYNFRVTLTKDPENSIAISKPENYNPDDYLILVEGMQDGSIDDLEDIVKGPSRQIPNNKADFNDRKGSKFSIKICNETDVWPEAVSEVRQQIWENAKKHTLGVFYFLQNDDRVLPAIQEEMKRWNLPKDEFTEYGSWPPLIYVREGRRLVGEYVYTQKDATQEKNSTRAPAFENAVAIGDYNLNSHGTYYTCDRQLLGNLGAGTRPYQIPFPVLLPKEVDGLLVPVAVSASRVGFGGIRMEPIWTALGQAAGLAAAQAVQKDIEPRKVDVMQLQHKLHDLGALTFYTSDVPPGSPYFEAVQFFGNRGLFQNLYDPEEVPRKRLKGLGRMVQWTEAYPYHDIQPDKIMTRELAKNWLNKLERTDDVLLKNAEAKTRGEFLQELFEQR